MRRNVKEICQNNPKIMSKLKFLSNTTVRDARNITFGKHIAIRKSFQMTQRSMK